MWELSDVRSGQYPDSVAPLSDAAAVPLGTQADPTQGRRPEEVPGEGWLDPPLPQSVWTQGGIGTTISWRECPGELFFISLRTGKRWSHQCAAEIQSLPLPLTTPPVGCGLWAILTLVSSCCLSKRLTPGGGSLLPGLRGAGTELGDS